MTISPALSSNWRTLTVRVPLALTKRGGRKLVVAPEGAAWAPPQKIDRTLLKALARAFRWRKMLESGKSPTVKEIAAAERINDSYVSRVLRLTLFAPDIVEAILDGKQPSHLQMADLLKPFPAEWERQRRVLRFAT